MLIGIALLIIGLIYLLRNLHIIALPVSFADILWPIILILIGAYILLGITKARRYKREAFRKYFRYFPGEKE
jgi:energy-converting hydrogenase Eha subunit C